MWPVDLSKIRLRPGGINYIYNLLLGYEYKPPFGLDIPKGKHFNPYFDHMIIGMPKQLIDGLIDYDDGTPASAPQMAYDVANFISYMQRREGAKKPDRQFRLQTLCFAIACFIPLKYAMTNSYFRG